jgi:MerR family transcriptional regulator, light-induced transcriptional regulator
MHDMVRDAYDAHMDHEAGVDATVSIAAVSSELDIPIPTIRSWERRYGFPAPARTGGSHRRYTRAEVEQLRRLRDLIDRGYPAHNAAARLASGAALGPADEMASELVEAAARLDTDAIRAALARAADRLTVEGAIRDVAFPALREIGARWRLGRCDVGQEHLASQTFRAWLARQAAVAPSPFRPAPIVLACGPRDLHTIGIEAFAVVLSRRGWPTRVLGAMTPPSALVSTILGVRAAGAVVTAQRSLTRRAAVESLAAVDAVPGVTAFYAGDAFAGAPARRGVPGTYLGVDVVRASTILERHVASDALE